MAFTDQERERERALIGHYTQHKETQSVGSRHGLQKSPRLQYSKENRPSLKKPLCKLNPNNPKSLQSTIQPTETASVGEPEVWE